MKRLPVLPTLLVAAAILIMIALGFWQLQRHEWKTRLLAEYGAAAALPALDLDPLLDRDESTLPPLAFRRVLVTCSARDAKPDLRGGRSQEGAGGYSYFIPCRPGAEGLGGRLVVNAGWSAIPDGDLRLSADGLVAGRLGSTEGGPVILTSAAASPPLQASAEPSMAQIPNNHFAYALQWFFFAAVAAIIYGLALRRRQQDRAGEPLPPGQ